MWDPTYNLENEWKYLLKFNLTIPFLQLRNEFQLNFCYFDCHPFESKNFQFYVVGYWNFFSQPTNIRTDWWMVKIHALLILIQTSVTLKYCMFWYEFELSVKKLKYFFFFLVYYFYFSDRVKKRRKNCLFLNFHTLYLLKVGAPLIKTIVGPQRFSSNQNGISMVFEAANFIQNLLLSY